MRAGAASRLLRLRSGILSQICRGSPSLWHCLRQGCGKGGAPAQSILVPTTSEPAGQTGESGIKVKVGVDPFKAALRRTATRWRERCVDWSAERGRGKRIGRAPIGLAAQARGRADLSRVGVAGAGKGTSEAAAGAASKSVFESAGAAAAARRATGQSRVARHRRENGRAATNRAARRGATCSKVLRLG